ncbi:MAG: MerR family transcriptional regulator [Acidobacteriota bacterium]|nr:MerR family transcriptional regulator [Acidobacteriota bacterium]
MGEKNPGPLLRIGEAAALVGVSPSTLRFWEKEGLITPIRHGGPTRYYSPELIERLRAIHRLKTDEGLNASGVRRVLDAESSAGGRGPGEPEHPGRRIRDRRLGRHLTLRQLARRSGLSASFLSSVEQGKANPSLGALRRISEALETTTQRLFGMRDAGSCRVVRPADRVHLEGAGALDASRIARPRRQPTSAALGDDSPRGRQRRELHPCRRGVSLRVRGLRRGDPR